MPTTIPKLRQCLEPEARAFFPDRVKAGEIEINFAWKIYVDLVSKFLITGNHSCLGSLQLLRIRGR
jgi:hypothetical protein